MRAGVVVAVGLIVVVVATASAAWMIWDDHAQAPDAAVPAETPKPAEKKPPPPRAPRRRAVSVEPPVDEDADVRAAWDAAVAEHKAGRTIEALTRLVDWRKKRAAWFAAPERKPVLDEMERATLALLAHAARAGTLEEARKLAAALRGVVLDEPLLRQAADLLAAAERRAAATQMAVGAEVVERAESAADKQTLARHLQRFADRGAPPTKKDWIDKSLEAVAAANQKLLVEPAPLPIPDPDAAEKRRLDQLEKLRQRNALGLLDPIDGALAWLALHQADDGRFGADATFARCKVLGHEPACVLEANAKEPHALAATGLAVLAYLDFRDQDVKRLFEPTLSRGIAWLLLQQSPDGSFKKEAVTHPWSKGYDWAIALMALGQAAGSTRDPAVVAAVKRGIGYFAKHHGKNGGYRYGIDQDGDLSVTGWFAQAVEAARNAGVVVPDEMTRGLDKFVGEVWRSPPKSAFAYTTDKPHSASIDPVGMLTMSILRPDSTQQFGDEWREFLAATKAGGNSAYFLYYAVRVQLFLDGKVSDHWRARLTDLSGKQTTKGPAAGMIPLENDGWFKTSGAGATIATAFATLTLEHSLYRR